MFSDASTGTGIWQNGQRMPSTRKVRNGRSSRVSRQDTRHRLWQALAGGGSLDGGPAVPQRVRCSSRDGILRLRTAIWPGYSGRRSKCSGPKGEAISASADSGEAWRGGDWWRRALAYEPRNHVIPLGKGCVTPRNCSLALPSDLIANASLSSSPQAQSPSKQRRASSRSKRKVSPAPDPRTRASRALVYQRACVAETASGLQASFQGLDVTVELRPARPAPLQPRWQR